MRITTAVAATTIAGALAATTLGLAGSAGAAPVSHAASARADWIKGAHVAAVDEVSYWNAASRQLAAYGSRDSHERADLAALTAIPLTSTTSAQRATATRVTRELNGFFYTAGLYGVSKGHAKKIARSDWVKSSEVNAVNQNAWLGAAKDELDAYGNHYRAERSDLTSLESIPLTNTTAKQRAAAHHDIHALDKFFHTPGVDA